MSCSPRAIPATSLVLSWYRLPPITVEVEVPSTSIPTPVVEMMLFRIVGLAFCSTRMPVPSGTALLKLPAWMNTPESSE